MKLAYLTQLKRSLTLEELSKNDLLELQSALSELGFYPDSMKDGVLGPATKKAWADYKAAKHQAEPNCIGPGSIGLLEKDLQGVKQQNKVDPSKHLFYELTPIRRVYLDLIAVCEGTDSTLNKEPKGYNVRYGFKTFSDFSKFPSGYISAGGWTSSASGRYQIMDFTWKTIQGALNFPSFEPQYQDQACLWLLHVKRNALKFVDSDDLWSFCQVCSYEWASIPPSRYGQSHLTYAQVKKWHAGLKQIYGLS